MRYLTSPLALFVLALPQLATAQTCDLVADINTSPVPLSSWPGGAEREAPVELAGALYFRAWTKATGMELFRTDGTTSSTVLVADILPGPSSSNPLQLTAHAGRLYFTAEDPIAGRELWSSDGTAAGTSRVKDIGPGAADGQIGELVSAGSRLFFVADDGATGLEVWSSDGTAMGTQLVADVLPGPASPEPAWLVFDAVGSRMYLSATLPGLGREVAFVDTQTMQPGLLKDIVPGAASSEPEQLVMLGSKLLFRALDPTTEYEPWVSDGTAAGTTLLLDIKAGAAGSYPKLKDGAVLGNELFFAASEGVNGTELWKTDGTAGGTQLMTNISPGSMSSHPADIVAMGHEVYFSGHESLGVERELFATASTPGSVRLVKDLRPYGSSDPTDLVVSGSQLFFMATEKPGEYTPWVSNGATAGTLQLMPSFQGDTILNAPAGFAALPGGGVAFSALGSLGVELFSSDGTPAGTGILADIAPTLSTGSSSPSGLTTINGQELYFAAFTSGTGRELWRGSPAGAVRQVLDIASGSSSSDPKWITQTWLGDHALTFFQADDGVLGNELWATDGTAAGTQLVKDIYPGADKSLPSDLTGALNRLFFIAKDPSLGSSLWVSDGTQSDTLVLSPPGLSASGGQPNQLLELGEQLLFVRKDVNGDRELWATDGTLARTKRVFNVNPLISSKPERLTRIDDQAVFVASLGLQAGANSIWVTDGFAAGTVQVTPTGSAPILVNASPFVELHGQAYFVTMGSPGIELWTIDPTAATTSKVATVSTSIFPTTNYKLTATNDELFFRASMQSSTGEELGHELVISDGTQAGTRLVADLSPGVASTNPTNITPGGGGVYFSPLTGWAGPGIAALPELHFSDGTALGTYMVCPSLPGDSATTPTVPILSYPTELTFAGGSLFWSANDPNGSGVELHRMPQSGGHAMVLEPSGSGQRIRSNDPILGTTLTVTGSLASTTDVSVLVMSAPVAAPHSTLVAYGSAAWVELASLSVLTTTATSNWTYTTALPATPALAGAKFTLQSWTLKGPTALPAETSNGLTIVLGN